jgi:hypothetical protein
MAVLLVAAATACMSHPAEHDHDLPHPFLCLDAQVGIEGQTILRQFATSGLSPSSLKFSLLGASSAGVNILQIVEQEAQDYPLRWALHQLAIPVLRALLAVLHL